LVGFNRFI